MSDHRSKSEIMRLRQELREAEELLKPFAAIKTSSWYPDDGSEDEGYHAYVTTGPGDFTGGHLARVREFLNRNKGE